MCTGRRESALNDKKVHCRLMNKNKDGVPDEDKQGVMNENKQTR